MTDTNKRLLCFGLWLVLLVLLAGCSSADDARANWPPGMLRCAVKGGSIGVVHVWAQSLGSGWIRTDDGLLIPREQVIRCWERP